MPLGYWYNSDWKKIFGDGIEFAELRDYRDYILDLEKIYKIQGQKLKHFRNGKNYFEKHFEYEVEEITPKIFDELFQFQVGENLKKRINRKFFVIYK